MTARSEHTDHQTNVNSDRFLRNMVKGCRGQMEAEFEPHVALMTSIVNCFRKSAGFIRRTRGRHPKVLAADTARLDMDRAKRVSLTSKEHKAQNQALVGALAGLCLRRGWRDAELRGMLARSARRIMRLGAADTQRRKPSSGTTELYRERREGEARNMVFNAAWEEVRGFKGASLHAATLCMADALLADGVCVGTEGITAEIGGIQGVAAVAAVETPSVAALAEAPEDGADDLDFAFE